MIDKIPQALLTNRIGGLSLAHETRKHNFHVEAPKFLRALVHEIGPLAAGGTVTTDQIPYRESGKVIYTSQYLSLEMGEDPLSQDGVRLHFRVLSEAGLLKVSGRMPMTRFAKHEALSEFIHEIQGQLQRNRASLH